MKTILTFIILSFAAPAFSQAPPIQWQKCLGGTGSDIPYSIRQTIDHGFIIAGWSKSNDGNVTGHHGDWSVSDAWVVKTDSTGNIQWERSYGGSLTDGATCIRATADGGYIFAGDAYSNDGDVTGHHGSTLYADLWVVKLDAEGNIQWENSYGGTSNETARDIEQTYDGGYVVAASTVSTDGDVTGHHGSGINLDYWIVKLSSAGNIQWENCFGGSSQEEPCSVIQTPDSGYFIAGYSISNDGDVTGHHGSLYNRDVWIININKSGKLKAEQSLPNYEDQTPWSTCLSSKSGYVIAGIGGGFPSHGISTYGDGDLMLLKVSKHGMHSDTACDMGGSGEDNAFSISLTSDGGYIIAGQTLSNNYDVTGYHGDGDCWIVKVDSNLKLQWEEALGGVSAELVWSAQQTNDGGYIVASQCDSNDGDVSGNHGSDDYWVVKLAPDNQPAIHTSNGQAKFSENNSNHLSVYPNPASNEVNISFPFSNNIITISDLVGREVERMEVRNGNSTLVDVGSLQDGVYILSIKDDKGNLVASKELFKQ